MKAPQGFVKNAELVACLELIVVCTRAPVQLQRACEATAHELAQATADKVAMQQNATQAQESVDALAAELQDTLAVLADKKGQVDALMAQLEAEQTANRLAAQNVSEAQHGGRSRHK